MKQYKKVFVAGVFDNFHIGHQYFLWTTSVLAKDMVIIVARDKTVQIIKGQKPKNNEKKRLYRIKQEKIKNARIRLGRLDGKFLETVKQEAPDILVLGYDQKINEKKFLHYFPNLVIQRGNPFYPQYFKSSLFLN